MSGYQKALIAKRLSIALETEPNLKKYNNLVAFSVF